MNICNYSYEEYLNLIKSFHGNIAPGMIIGGFMVDLAMTFALSGIIFHFHKTQMALSGFPN